MNKPLTRFNIRKAVKCLESSDKVLSVLIKKHGPCTISPALANPFHALASSIISQQISARAARAIKGRLLGLLGKGQFTPDGLLNLSPKQIRSAGLSGPKTEYIRGVAMAVESGRLDFPSLSNCEDEEVIESLVTLSGVGRWTAEMFLIFGLGRPDVLSVHDAGLRKGFQITYKLASPPTAAEMVATGERWRPYRSVASWYLWRVVD
jgi:DNA-3-methyladenine glycosylase II